MLKKLLSIAILASLALSAAPSFAGTDGTCTDAEKAENKQFYSNTKYSSKDAADCCCEKGASGKYDCTITAKGSCPVDPADKEKHIKLSGPDYCPCEFKKG